jgi:hypothetical protein
MTTLGGGYGRGIGKGKGVLEDQKNPTLDEVKAYAKERATIVDPVWFHEFYANGNPPWHDSRGNPVRAWKQKFIMHEKHGHIGGKPPDVRPLPTVPLLKN